MFSISPKVIVVADSRKFDRRCFACIGPVAEIDFVVTDSAINEGDKTRLEKSEVEVIVA